MEVKWKEVVEMLNKLMADLPEIKNQEAYIEVTSMWNERINARIGGMGYSPIYQGYYALAAPNRDLNKDFLFCWDINKKKSVPAQLIPKESVQKGVNVEVLSEDTLSKEKELWASNI